MSLIKAKASKSNFKQVQKVHKQRSREKKYTAACLDGLCLDKPERCDEEFKDNDNEMTANTN